MATFGVATFASGSALAQTDLSLYIVEQCAPLAQGGRCGLGLVQMPDAMLPSGKVQSTCTAGWLAHIGAERGTVEKGGVNRGQAVVCGYAEPQEAIRAVLLACNEQTLGICRDANYVNVQWAFWSGDGADLKQLPMDVTLQIEQLPQAQQCASVVPLTESVSCPPAAAVLLRQNGLR